MKTKINEWLKEKKEFDKQRFIDTSSGKALLDFYNETRQEARKELIEEVEKMIDEVNIHILDLYFNERCENCNKNITPSIHHFIDVFYKELKDKLKYKTK